MKRLIGLVLAIMFMACKAPVAPNVIIIITDDQNIESLSVMSTVQEELAAKGITFTNAFVTTPICCPSRASYLTGRRIFNHGVLTNFHPLELDPATTIAKALQDIGYTTALVGKYFNLYIPTVLPPTAPDGWSQWYAMYSGLAYYNYDMAVNGAVVHYGSDNSDYITDVLNDYAVNFIDTAPVPFFLYVAPPAPHDPVIGAPRHEDVFEGMLCDTNPATMEIDTSDKPEYINLQRLRTAPTALETNCENQNLRKDALLSVDEMVADLINAVAARGLLKNTVFIYTSDNGLMNLEHWWPWKMVPYEDSIRVPLIVRYDKWITQKGVDRNELVLNIDVASTLAELAGAVLPVGADGADWTEYYLDESIGWRTDFPIEYEMIWPWTTNPSWKGVRGAWDKYVLYDDGFEEYYDLLLDPWELNNIAVSNPSDPRLLDARARHQYWHGE